MTISEHWIWKWVDNTMMPQAELRYEYTDSEQLKRVSAVDQSETQQSGYGPEKYVGEYSYDELGRVVRKEVRDNSADYSSLRDLLRLLNQLIRHSPNQHLIHAQPRGVAPTGA